MSSRKRFLLFLPLWYYITIGRYLSFDIGLTGDLLVILIYLAYLALYATNKNRASFFAWLVTIMIISLITFPLIKSRVENELCDDQIFQQYGTLLDEHNKPFSKEYLRCIEKLKLIDIFKVIKEELTLY